MSYEDFCRCEVNEFTAIYNAWKESRESQMRDSWEQTRILAAIMIQPYSKKKITPRQLIPLPWDTDKDNTLNEPVLTKEERMKRFMKVAKV